MVIVMRQKTMLVLDKVLTTLKGIFEKFNDIEVVILFGSLVNHGATYHDIDIAIKFKEKGNFIEFGRIVTEIARALNVNEEVIDIVDLEKANPVLLWKILSHGIIIKGDENFIKDLKKRIRYYLDIVTEVSMWINLDPEPKPDRFILTSRIEEIRGNANFLRTEILVKKPGELTYKDILALERAVHRIIEAMLDICRHLISVYSLGFIESYSKYPRKLAEAGKMPKQLANEVSKLISLGNILVHRYLEIDLEKLYKATNVIVNRIAKEFITWASQIVQ